MHLGLGIQLGSNRPAYSPADLFANGEQGFTFPDLNPALGLLFQDSAGTTPATTAGDPVALVLDRSGNGNDAIQDVNTNFRPILRQEVTGEWYLEFDGGSYWLYIPTLDMSGTDKITAFVGAYKGGAVSDATTFVLAEHSADFGSNNGSFRIAAPVSSAGFALGSTGTIATGTKTGSGYDDPSANVSTWLADIGTPSTEIRVDGVSAVTAAKDAGTGNFGVHPFYIGARAGTSFFFEGKLYSLTVLGRTATSAEIGASERYVASKTAGVSL